MVTIVNDYYTPSNTYSMYEGMSISDAANYMVLECNNAIHDLEMDILLTEHAYLLENGYEIEYINEEGEATKQGNGVIAKILQTIDKFIKFIKELFDKLITTISEKMALIVASFLKIGITKDKVSKVVQDLTYNHAKIPVSLSASTTITMGEIENVASSVISTTVDYTNNKTYEPGSLYNEYVDTGKNEFTIGVNEFKVAADLVFSHSNNIKRIRKIQKDAETELKTVKKNIQKDKQFTADSVKSVNAALKNNSLATKDIIRIINLMFTNSVKIVRAGISYSRKSGSKNE